MTIPMLPYKRRLWDDDDAEVGTIDMGMTEREHVYWGVTKEGDRRVKGYVPYVPNADQNFRVSNVIAYNYRTDALGRNWLQANFQVGSVDDELDFWYPAFWDADNVPFNFIWGVDEQLGLYGHKPRVISLVDDGNGVLTTSGPGLPVDYAGLYFTAQQSAISGGGVASSLEEAGGWIGHWNGLDLAFSDGIDTSQWVRRTPTDDAMDDGSHFGWGFSGSFTGGVDLTGPFDLTAVPLFPTYIDATTRDAHTEKPPGYGHVAVLWPRVLFPKFGERWYSKWDGYIYDRGSDPIQDGDGNWHRYACSALVALNEGENPGNAAAWARVVGIFAPFDVDGPYDAIHDAGDKEHSLFSGWVEQYGGKMYFTASPINLPTELGLTDGDIAGFDTCVYCLDGVALVESLHWFDTRSTGSALVQYGGKLYFPMLSVPEQAIFIWRLDDPPSGWAIVASIPVSIDGDDEVEGSRPFVVTAWGHNGRISVVYGKRPSIFNDAYDGTGPASTAWSMKTWTISTGVVRTLTASFPGGFSSDDHGTWVRLFPLKLTDLTGGGGFGGSGPCDDTYSAFGSSTISEAEFASVMSSFSSPLLGEHTASHFYGMCTGAGLNPSFAIAQWIHETQIGSDPGDTAGFNNVGLIRCHTWGTQIGCGFSDPTNGYFAEYSTWTDSVQDYVDLISGPAYSGLSISEIISKYAPSFENATATYIANVCAFMLAHDS